MWLEDYNTERPHLKLKIQPQMTLAAKRNTEARSHQEVRPDQDLPPKNCYVSIWVSVLYVVVLG